MGKWKYINLIILIVAAIYMYLYIHERYKDNINAYIYSSLGIILCYALGHYIFVHKMNKQKQKNDSAKETIPKPPFPESRPKARPKVVLKPKPKKDE